MTHSRLALVVEDQQLWREDFFGDTLTDLGFTVFAATTKDQALHLLEQHRFDLAVIDINLTDVPNNSDGLTVIQHGLNQGQTFPVIVVSGSDGGFSTLHERGIKVFAELRKDTFQLDEFIALVQQATAPLDP